MDKFESQFETLDVQTAQMEDTMGNTTTLTTPQVTGTVLTCETWEIPLNAFFCSETIICLVAPQNEVDTLLHEMADEAGWVWPVPPDNLNPIISVFLKNEMQIREFK